MSDPSPPPLPRKAKRGAPKAVWRPDLRDGGVWPPLLLLAFGFLLVAFLPAALAVPVVALVFLLDGLILSFGRSLEPGEVRLTLSVRPEGDLDATFAGATAIARLALVKLTPGGVRHVNVTLLVPPGVEILGPALRRFSADPERPCVHTYRLRLDRVGVVVFPGALFSRHGPLGLVHRSMLIFSRSKVPVLPDHERSLHPVVARYLRPGSRPGELVRGRAVKGGGTEFAGIRDHVPGDPERRMDWKATARRARMLVREYEEPREFTVRMVVDASVDLAGGADYTRVAALVAKLGFIASRESMGLTVTAYDEKVVLSRTLRGDRAAFRRLIAELVKLPRSTLIDTARTRLTNDDLRAALGRELKALAGDWRPGGIRESAESLLSRLFGEPRPDAGEVLSALADLAPGALLQADARCPFCRERRFPDEGSCGACGRLLFPGGLAPRALCLAGVLEGMARTARGRELWVLVSSFKGGELCREVSDRLVHAVTPYRRVHVVLPTIAELTDDAARWPGTLGQYPTREGTQRDVESLYVAERLRSFVRTLCAAGIRTHALEDARELEEVVARVLLSEVIG